MRSCCSHCRKAKRNWRRSKLESVALKMGRAPPNDQEHLEKCSNQVLQDKLEVSMVKSVLQMLDLP